MNFEVKPVGSVYGQNNEVVRIDKNMRIINVKTDSGVQFAVLICMTCESHQNRVKKILIAPNVNTHAEAYEMAKQQHSLSGEWATQVGVSLFNSNVDFAIPQDWEKCEEQFHNGERV